MSREQVRFRLVYTFQLKNKTRTEKKSHSRVNNDPASIVALQRRTTCFSVKKVFFSPTLNIFSISHSRESSLNTEYPVTVMPTKHIYREMEIVSPSHDTLRSLSIRRNEFHMRIVLWHATWCITCWLRHHRISQWEVIYGVQLASLGGAQKHIFLPFIIGLATAKKLHNVQ